MLKKILEIVNNNEEAKNIVLDELKNDSEMNLFVDLMIEMIEEKNKKTKNIDFIDGVTSEKNKEVEYIIKQNNEKIKELKEKGKVAIKERDIYKKNIEDLKIESNQKINKLKEKINNLEIQNNNLMQKISSMKNENTDLNNKLFLASENIIELNNRIAFLDNKYKELENVYSKFNNLSDDTKVGLSGIFKNIDNIDLFLFCGAEYDKLEMFWEFIKNAIINEQHKDDIDNMNYIFDYFFDRYNKVVNEIYERIEVRPGEEFDTEYHIRKGNKPSGEISRVMLTGFRNRNTKKVIKKTVVSL